jgi:hypothetical protein
MLQNSIHSGDFQVNDVGSFGFHQKARSDGTCHISVQIFAISCLLNHFQMENCWLSKLHAQKWCGFIAFFQLDQQKILKKKKMLFDGNSFDFLPKLSEHSTKKTDALIRRVSTFHILQTK